MWSKEKKLFWNPNRSIEVTRSHDFKNCRALHSSYLLYACTDCYYISVHACSQLNKTQILGEINTYIFFLCSYSHILITNACENYFSQFEMRKK
jgi:hypothetical protein